MASYRNSDLDHEERKIEQDSQADYPVHVSFIDLSKMYMQQIRWHWHPEIEVIIINHGEADLTANGRILHLQAGQGVLINRNVMHALSPTGEDPNCSIYSTVFHPSFLFGDSDNAMSGKFLPPVFDSPALKALFLTDEDPFAEKLLDLINSVIAANLTKKYGYELATKAYLCQFWIRLLGYTASPQTKSRQSHTIMSDEERIKKVICYMEDHYAEQITLEKLAAFIGISRSECCRCFKRALHLTPIEYLLQLRIFHAAAMIRENGTHPVPMSELARKTGFHNASYFNKVFRQFMHCTPSEYRRTVIHDPV